MNVYIFYFSVLLDGKNKVVDVKFVLFLVRFFKDKEFDVRVNVVGVFMM